MWAQINADFSIGRIFSRPQPLSVIEKDGEDNEHRVNYPATVFRNSTTLRRLGIVPVRRVQVNAPDDTVGWESSSTYELKQGYVEQRVTWTMAADYDQKRAERDKKVARSKWEDDRVRLHDFMFNKGYLSSSEMTPADWTAFHAADPSMVRVV